MSEEDKTTVRSPRERVVIDTNLVLSALIFGGRAAALRTLWQGDELVPLVSAATAGELIRVLAYPKFRLDSEDREQLLGDYLPYCESVRVPDPPPPTPPCRDPFDTPFLELALAGDADALITGDRDLLALASVFECPIVSADAFLERVDGGDIGRPSEEGRS